MKILFSTSALLFTILIFTIVACKKKDTLLSSDHRDTLTNKLTNKNPIANAGPDQIIFSPNDTALLDGGASFDLDGKIVAWHWTKVSGPESVVIKDSNTIKTTISNLILGVYEFKLTVTDNSDLVASDIMQIKVQASPNPSCDGSMRPLVPIKLSEIGKLSVPRTPSIAAAGSKVVFAGGSYQYSLPPGRIGSLAVDIYDVNSHEWKVAQLSQARDGIAAVSCGNKIFFAGGDQGEKVFDNVDVYDVSTDSWTLLHLSEPRTCITAKAFGTKVFFAGGTSNWIKGTTTIDIYDVVTNSWSVSQLSEPKYDITIVVEGNKVYFTCGHDLETWYFAVDIYDGSTGTWSTSKLDYPYDYIFDLTLDGTLYWIYPDYASHFLIRNTSTGGSKIECLTGNFTSVNVKDHRFVFQDWRWVGGNTSIAQVEIYDPQTRNCVTGVIPAVDTKLFGINGALYMAGGYNSATGLFEDKVYSVSW